MAAARVDSPLSVHYIPIKLDSANPKDSAREIAFAFNPSWKTAEGEVEVDQFTDGITNALCKVTKKSPGRTDSQNDDEAVLVRGYGNGTDVIIDREKEMKAHNLLSSMGLAPALLARFENGLLYRFVQGHVCSPADLRNPNVYRQTAKTLGQWHATLPISAITATPNLEKAADDNKHAGVEAGKQTRPMPNLWSALQQWVDALPNKTEKDRERNHTLNTELATISARFGNTPGLAGGKDYIFSHPDLLHGNIIVQSPTGTPADLTKENPVTFIDYEYCVPGPPSFDLANHFAEWAGFELEYGGVPTKSQRRDFIKHYVGSYRYHAITDEDTLAVDVDLQADVDQLYAQVDAFRGIPGFFWGVWGLIQAQISLIDFDFSDYADKRLGEYWAWKAEEDGSRKRKGEELSLRERRWAEE